MPLDESELSKVCRRRMFKASIPDSTGTYLVAEPHYGVIVSRNDALAKNPREWQAIMVSTELSYDDVFVVEIPKYLRLTGKFICSWFPNVLFTDTVEFFGLLEVGDFDRVVKMASKYQQGRHSYGHAELIRRVREGGFDQG